jgi:hypothetical protein
LGLVRKYLDLGWSVVATERQPSATSALGQLTAENAERLSTIALDINQCHQPKLQPCPRQAPPKQPAAMAVGR